jgi:hypothetical protein
MVQMPTKPPKNNPSKTTSAKSARCQTKGSDYLFDELLPRRKAALTKINTEADLAKVAAWLVPLLNADPRLGMMFLADTESFCRDFGFELGPTIQKHLRENAIFYKQRDPKLYQALKNGEKIETGITGLRFRLSPELQKLVPAASLKDLQQAIEDRKLALDPTLAARFFAPPPAARRKQGGIGIVAPGSTMQALTTGGWNVVVQIQESFYQDMYTLYFEAMNALYFVMLVGEVFGSTTPAETVNPDPNHEMLTWFFRWIRVRFRIPAPPVPLFVLDGGAPLHPSLSGTMRFDFTIEGRIESGDSPDDFDLLTPFTATVSHWGRIGGHSNGQPLNSAMENYYGATMNGGTSVTLASGPDSSKEIFIGAAVDDYFAKELPEILILPSPHIPPFITFDQSAMHVVEDSATDRQAITLLFGQPGGPAEVFTEMLTPTGRNITLGLHRGAATQMIEQKLPDLPITEDTTHIERLDINLRDGYIEVSGDGFVELGWYFGIDFDFTSRVTLAIDNKGNLTAHVSQTEVSSTWANVHAVLVGISSPAGPIIGAIGWALFNFVAGGFVGGEVQNQLNVNQNFNEQFSFQLGVGNIDADFRDVEITRNGIFIHGSLSVSF